MKHYISNNNPLKDILKIFPETKTAPTTLMLNAFGTYLARGGWVLESREDHLIALKELEDMKLLKIEWDMTGDPLYITKIGTLV